MPRVIVNYRPSRIPVERLHDQVLSRLKKLIAKAVSTEQGPVIDEEVVYKVEPYGLFDGPMHDIDLIVTLYPFADRLASRQQIVAAILGYVNAVTEAHITVGVWIDWVEMDYTEYPDRTR